MTYPTIVRIAGVDYEVKYDKNESNLGRELYGCINYADAEIHVDATRKDYFIRKVLLHEIIHGVSNGFGADLTETQTLAMENGLWQLFNDNPDLYAGLFTKV